MSDLIHIPFHGGDVLATTVDDKPYILLRPVVERLGLSYAAQTVKLKGKSWACVAEIETQVPGDVQKRRHKVVDVRTLLMLLAGISENKVAESVRPLLIAYQADVADAIEAYFASKRPPSSEVVPLSGIEYAKRLLDAEIRAEAGQQFKRAIEAGDGLSLRSFHKKYFSAVKEHHFFDHLYRRGYLINQLGKGSRRDDGSYRDGSQHRHPGHLGKPWIYLHTTVDRTGARRDNSRVRPGDVELSFRDRLAKEGLVANEHSTGLHAIEGGAL